MKKLLSIILTAVMLMSLFPMISIDAQAADPETRTLFFVQSKGAFYDNWQGTGDPIPVEGATWHSDTQTLTLENVHWETTADYALYTDDDITLELVGDNSLISNCADYSGSYALYVDGDLTITGSGSLTVKSSKNSGIRTFGSLALNGTGKIVAEGGSYQYALSINNSGTFTYSEDYCWRDSVGGALRTDPLAQHTVGGYRYLEFFIPEPETRTLYFRMTDGKFYDASSGGNEITVSGASWNSTDKILTLNNVTWETKAAVALHISGISSEDFITLNLVGDNSLVSTYEGGANTYGINMVSVGLIITGDGTLTATGGTDTVTSYSMSSGIQALSFTLNDGTVIAKGGKMVSTTGNYAECFGINAGEVTINGGELRAIYSLVTSDGGTGYAYGIFSSSTVTINGGHVYAGYEGYTYADNRKAIQCSSSSFTLGEGVWWRESDSDKYSESVFTLSGQAELEFQYFDYWHDGNHRAASFASIDTSEKTITIANAAQLGLFAYNLMQDDDCYDDYTITLTDDIDLSGADWMPVNATGITFDGAGHKISGLNVVDSVKDPNEPNVNCSGLFGFLDASMVIDTTFASPSVIVACAYAQNSVGVVAGSSFGSEIYRIVLENPTVNLEISTGSSGAYVGGVVGYAGEGATIINHISGVDVHGGSVTVTVAEGNQVSTALCVGGIAGANASSIIISSAVYNTKIVLNAKSLNWMADNAISGIAGYTSGVRTTGDAGYGTCLLNNLSLARVNYIGEAPYIHKGMLAGHVDEDNVVNNLYLGEQSDNWGVLTPIASGDAELVTAPNYAIESATAVDSALLADLNDLSENSGFLAAAKVIIGDSIDDVDMEEALCKLRVWETWASGNAYGYEEGTPKLGNYFDITSINIVEGTVTDEADKTVTVTLMHGNEEVAQVTAVEDPAVNGTYTFRFLDVPDGIYNLVADNGDYIVTQAVIIPDDLADPISIDMGTGKTQSVVEIAGSDTPPTAVGGLPELFEDEKLYTAADELIVDGGGTVEMKLVVNSITEASDEEQIKGEVASNEKIGLFLDISLIKSQFNDQGNLIDVGKKLTDLNGNRLTITFELPSELSGKTITAIYRTHGSSVDRLTNDSAQDEYFTQTGDIITLHVSKFSTYALAVEKTGGYIPGIDIDTEWKNPYTDVKAEDWFYDAVQYVTENKLMDGAGDRLFEPYGDTSRAMVATILWRLAGQPKTGKHEFVDVADGQWYSQAIAWAAENKIVKGYGKGIFLPERSVSREEMSAMLYRYVQWGGGGFADEWLFLLDFADSELISDWAYESVCYCAMHGIVEGRPGGIFDPQGKATRSEIAVVIMRFCAE